MPESQSVRATDLRLLLVEDDEAYARLVRTMLESVVSVQFQYDHSASLRAAIKRLMAAPYDVVLLDLGLPDARELEALTSLVDLAPDTPVVVLSGAEDEGLAVQAVKAGAQDYLIKGQATPEVLGRSVRYAIERKQSEIQMKRLAYRDSLTQLPNRLLFMEQLDGALKRARRDGHIAGLVFIDVDNFKQINDTFGHEVGDDVLQQVGQRLRQALRDNDTLARLGGDEFVAIVEVAQRSALILVTENLLKHLRAPFTAAGRELFITASIGVSSYPSDGTDASELLRNADRAMYRAKSEGRDTHRF